MFFLRLFDLCLFGFVGFLFLLCLGRAAFCDCGTPWTFLLSFSGIKQYQHQHICYNVQFECLADSKFCGNSSINGCGASAGNTFSTPALSLDITHISNKNSNKASFTLKALPLDATVSQKVKEKIWANEYVDLSTVFDDDVWLTSHFSLNFSGSGASVSTNSRRRYITIEQWTDLFAKYASVMPVKYPESCEALAKYLDTVRFIAKSNGNWHFYDTKFRKLRHSMGLPWDMIPHKMNFKALIQKPSFRKKKSDAQVHQTQVPLKNSASNLTKGNIVPAVHFSMPVASVGERIMPCFDASNLRNQTKEKADSRLILDSNKNQDQVRTSQVLLPKSNNVALPTPASWRNLQFLLEGYDQSIINDLVEGLKNGISIHFSGEVIPGDHKTLISARQNPDIVD